LVEDDHRSASAVVKCFGKQADWEVIVTGTGQALDSFLSSVPLVVVVSSSPPPSPLNGVETCRALRALSSTLGIILVSDRSALQEKLRAFAAGVDDYLITPFDVRELVARVESLVRRIARPTREPQAATASHKLVWDTICVNLARQGVSVNGCPVDLSKCQFRLLVYLIKEAGRTVREPELREHVLGTVSVVKSSTVRNHIHQLRLRLGPAGALIQSVPGGGYRMAPFSHVRELGGV
jgi:two-component system phosphate regulon response regulator PhoB